MKLNLSKHGITLTKPDSNIKYAWNVYVPKNIKNIMLWGYSGPRYDSYENEISQFNDHIEIITDECEKYNTLAISVFLPRDYQSRTYPQFKFNAQIMTQETMIENLVEVDEFYKRPDIEVLKIIELVKENLKDLGASQIPQKISIAGVSSGANFANRFSLLYPHLIKNVALLCAGDFMYPVENLNGVDLKYPFGTYDLNLIPAVKFDSNQFRNIPHYIYVGQEDYNDPIEYELRFPELVKEYKKVLGETVPERTRYYADFLKQNGNEVKFRMEPGIGHKVAKGVFDDAFMFLN